MGGVWGGRGAREWERERVRVRRSLAAVLWAIIRSIELLLDVHWAIIRSIGLLLDVHWAIIRCPLGYY
jgi:hypothetical protein